MSLNYLEQGVHYCLEGFRQLMSYQLTKISSMHRQTQKVDLHFPRRVFVIVKLLQTPFVNLSFSSKFEQMRYLRIIVLLRRNTLV